MHKLFDNLRNNNILLLLYCFILFYTFALLLLPLENHLIVQILLFGSENYDSTANKIIISYVIEFITKSKRFDPMVKLIKITDSLKSQF